MFSRRPILSRHLARAFLRGCLLWGGLAPLAFAARPEVSLNPGWRFHYGETGGDSQAAVAAAENWPAIDLPHTWNAQDGADGGGNYARGTGWYVRHFALDPAWAGRRIFLQFDGASRSAEVFLNGERLGEHRGGFARFRFDITSVAHASGDNVLAVRVSNAPDGTPPVSADFTFFGGIYRGVHLFTTDPVHVNALDFGADAVYLTPHDVTADHAGVSARITVRNDGMQPVSATVRLEVRDAAGQKLVTSETPVQIAAGGEATCEPRVTLDHPHLWNGRADPYLHNAVVSIWSGGQERDELAQPIGLRSFRVDPDQGFFLNGQYLDLHGVTRHQDRAGKGWAIGAAEDREDFSIIKEIGATALRVAHYPQSDLWFDLADQNGLVVWAEIPVVNEVPAKPGYTDNAEQQLRELIRQHFNHPSICFWGVGNETREASDTVGHETVNAPSADKLIARLNDLAHLEDSSRLTTYASHHKVEDVRGFHTDVLAFNKYFGWYGGKADDLAGFLDKAHAEYPKRAIGMSEYGAGANPAQHDTKTSPPKPGGPWHPEEYQAWLHEKQWAALSARPWVWGKFLWNLFDFASDGRSEGEQPGINDKGLVTYDRRTRKDAFWFYKASWSNEPVLYLASRRFTARTSRDAEIKLYSNLPHVEVSLNGQPCAKPRHDGVIWRWPVQLADGENRVVARAQTASGEVTDECTWTLAVKATAADQ